jgi:hypothetical protein
MNAFGSIFGCPLWQLARTFLIRPRLQPGKTWLRRTGKIIVEQTFLSAGGGTFQFRFGRLESRPNPQAGKPALQLKLALDPRFSITLPKPLPRTIHCNPHLRNLMFDVGCWMFDVSHRVRLKAFYAVFILQPSTRPAGGFCIHPSSFIFFIASP